MKSIPRIMISKPQLASICCSLLIHTPYSNTDASASGLVIAIENAFSTAMTRSER